MSLNSSSVLDRDELAGDRLDTVVRWRWLLIIVFGLSSTLNYLDRQLLAAVAPSLKLEFGLSNTDYGLIVSAFSLTYMLTAPLGGLLIDRVGLRLGASLAVMVWSTMAALTGVTRGLFGLVTMRMGLGVAEAAGVPCSSKATASYLKPYEFGLGNAIQSLDMTLGAIAAPLVVAGFSNVYGWRGVFVICGALGVVWVAVWLTVSRTLEPDRVTRRVEPIGNVIASKKLWGIVLGSALVMGVQSLWMNWTTVYLVEQQHLTQITANQFYAWIPPIFASLGSLAGGTIAFRLLRRGKLSPIRARLRASSMAVPLLLTTAIIPYLPNAKWAILAISMSFCGCTMAVINVHVLPIDLFGAKRAAFTSSVLVGSYALVQMILSPVIGTLMDHTGFRIVCLMMSILSVSGIGIVRWVMKLEGS